MNGDMYIISEGSPVHKVISSTAPNLLDPAVKYKYHPCYIKLFVKEFIVYSGRAKHFILNQTPVFLAL